MKRKKLYYVPGLISLIGLPILLAFWGPEDPVQANVMRLFLPSDKKPPPGMSTFDRYTIGRAMERKKIVEIALDDRPSPLHPEYNAYRKSNLVLEELSRLQFTRDTSEILKVRFTGASSYGEFVWTLNNAIVFGYRRFYYLDDALYFLANPPPPTLRTETLLPDFGPEIILPSPPPPTKWELFEEWAHGKWLYMKYYFRYNQLLISGFLLLIIIPGIVGTVRRYRANRPLLAVRP